MMQRYGHLPAFALGGAVGAGVRWWVREVVTFDSFPWHTLLVNVIGCALLAFVTARELPLAVNRLFAVGFCGGLTTFSTFAVEVVELLDDGRPTMALTYVALSLALGLVAFIGVRSQFSEKTIVEESHE
jgi:CrcB protein